MRRFLEEDLPMRAGIVLYDDFLNVLVVHPTGMRKTQWDFPKGHFDSEKDATLYETAARECKEETGIEINIEDIEDAKNISGNYNGTFMTLFIVEHNDINLNHLFCKSKIDANCRQEWKIGLPENDDFMIVHYSELKDCLYKSYKDSGLLESIEDYFKSVEDANRLVETFLNIGRKQCH